MKVLGQIEDVCLEQLSVDPSANTQGRIFQNTTDGHAKLDSGSAKRSFLLNDEKLIIGLDGTLANNVRFHKATSGLIQDVLGNDTTVDGTSATALAQRSVRDENKTDATLPAAGNAGRSVYVSDQKVIAVDDGVNWRKVIPKYSVDDASTGTNVAISAITSSVIRLTSGSLVSVQTIAAGFSGQSLTLINRTGVNISIVNNGGSPAANRILTGTGVDYILPVNAAVTLEYDATTQSWQALISSTTLTAPVASAISTKTSNYTLVPTDATIIADATAGAFSLTLPDPADVSGQKFILKKSDNAYGNAVSIIGTIDGQTDWKLWTIGETLEIHSDGTAYNKINHITDTDWIDAGSIVNFYQFTITSGAASAGATYTKNGNTYTVAKTIGAQQYTFTLSPAASASAGAVYTNGGKSFTVVNTISGGTTLVTNGTGTPQASGVLTKSSGTGDAAINFSTSSTTLTVVGLADPTPTGTLTRTSGTGDVTLALLSFTGSAQLITATTTYPVFNLTPVKNTFKFKRTGKEITVWINYYQSAGGVTTGNGDYLWPMPVGIFIDTTAAPLFNTGSVQASIAGTAVLNQFFYPSDTNGWLTYQGIAALSAQLVGPYTTSRFRIWGYYNNAQLYSPGSTYIPATIIGAYNFKVTLPVQDWKA